MAESTLSLSNIAIAKEVGFYLSYGRDSTAWTAEQIANLRAVLDSGYRQFLVPPAIGGRVHEWTFLRPITTLVIYPDVAVTAGVTVTQSTTTLTANANVFYPAMVGRTVVITGQATNRTITAYTSPTAVTVSISQTIASGATFSIASEGRFRLADDFAGLDGLVTFAAWTNQFARLPLTNELVIRSIEQGTLQTGIPAMCAIVANNAAGAVGQRFDLAISPQPDALYTIKFRYNANPGTFALDFTTVAYPLGGMSHAETLLESCLAMAERRFLDGGTGAHMADWMARLQSSIEFDIRTMTPEYLGYNVDRSDGYEGRDEDRRIRQTFYCTHDGVLPTA